MRPVFEQRQRRAASIVTPPCLQPRTALIVLLYARDVDGAVVRASMCRQITVVPFQLQQFPLSTLTCRCR